MVFNKLDFGREQTIRKKECLVSGFDECVEYDWRRFKSKMEICINGSYSGGYLHWILERIGTGNIFSLQEIKFLHWMVKANWLKNSQCSGPTPWRFKIFLCWITAIARLSLLAGI